MNKKAFTLVELLAVVVILAVIGIIIVPVVINTINSNTEKLYEAQIDEIKTAAEKYALYNLSDLPLTENDILTITLKDIKDANLIDINIKNPKTEELFADNMLINIKFINNKYTFTVLDEGVVEDNQNAPKININGDILMIEEVNSTFTDPGATAYDKNNQPVTIDIQYKKGDLQIHGIDTKNLGTFTIVYSANFIENSQVYTSYVFRTVIIEDSVSPIITFNGKLTLTAAEANGYDLTKDVVVTDNSGETLTVTVTGYDSFVGEKVITYTATDSSGNKTEEKRIVEIVE